MVVGLFRERHRGERRVALVPGDARGLSDAQGAGFVVERGAGRQAGVRDEAWEEVGARLVDDPHEVARAGDVHLRIHPPDPEAGEPDLLPGPGRMLVCLASSGDPRALARRVSASGGSLLALERVPRSTRAQAMDVLSSQATVAGYRAALLAATRLPRFFPMLSTAAGTIRPARVLVIGAGVAGLQAMATARRLGAAVTGHDIRPAALEQIRSLGATTLVESATAPGDAEDRGGYARTLDEDESTRQEDLLARRIGEFDVVVTTAQVPGRPAPRIVSTAMVEGLPPGAVVVDLAAASGGNCEPSIPDREVRVGAALVLAPTNPASDLAEHASAMFSRNVAALLRHLPGPDPDPEQTNDEILRALSLVHRGRLVESPPEPEPGHER